MNPFYKVPIIPQNLRKDETIVQIADALKYLSVVSHDIFNKINKRIETNTSELSSLSNRINVACGKIENLKGAKKATQVFSSSKYPAADVHRQYKSIFDDHQTLAFSRSKVKYKDMQSKDEPIETLQFYHVKIQEPSDLPTVDGLGEIPADITSINDLLLYNTAKNPYKNYVMSDPLQTSIQTKKDENLDVIDIGAAPHSILEGTSLTRSTTESYFYSPDLGEVPLLDVPLDLPDLPGVADDLRYINDGGPGIAPSVTTTPNIPELPSLSEVETATTESNLEILAVPPPPPPPPIKVITETLGRNKSTITKEQTVSQPSELQLFPLESPVVIPSDTVKPESDSFVKPIINIDNAHASLMEAIRQAGGIKNAKLRSAEPKKAAPTGDLMADLHLKLSLRRKGISGSKSQNNPLDTGSAMTKVSAMIPPPPVKSETDLTNTEDEDWDE